MKIGIISDTHDRLETIQKAVDIFREQKVEMIVHCGDWVSPFTVEFFNFCLGDFQVPVKGIFGNNEGDVKGMLIRNAKLDNPAEFSRKATLDLAVDGKKIIVYHGDDKNILRALIASQEYDAVFTGHTHMPKNEVSGKTLIINPGSTSFARESRITKEATVAIYNSETNKAEIKYL